MQRNRKDRNIKEQLINKGKSTKSRFTLNLLSKAKKKIELPNKEYVYSLINSRST